jgi:hypothetical protein
LSIEFLASAALAGIPPDKFLNTEDLIELRCLMLVANKAVEYQMIQRDNLAAQIINYLGKALNSGN